MKSRTAELIRKYLDGPGDLIAAVEGLTDAELDKRIEPGKWSIRQQVNHLADAEMNLIHRMKKVIAEDNPLLPAFDQDKWLEVSSMIKHQLMTQLHFFSRFALRWGRY